MSALRPQVYRFGTAAQWQRCILHRFDTNKNGSLAPTVRLGLRAERVVDDPVYTVAVGPYGTPLWRLDGRAAPSLKRLDEFGAAVGPFEIDGTLAGSPRWIMDRDWLWAFDRSPARVRRYDRESLQLDLTIDADSLAIAVASPANRMCIADIASDGHEGVWVLLQSDNDVDWLVHLDCEGRLRDHRRTPCEVGRLANIGIVKPGKSLALLKDDGTWLWLMDVTDGTVQRAVRLHDLLTRWSATRLATDARNRIALSGIQTLATGERWSLFLLDSSGDVLDGPLADLFSDNQQTTTCPRSSSPIVPTDLGVCGDTVWFATSQGLWRLDSSEACRARESESWLLTPALLSPQTSAHRGWLRAEVTIDLPRGAVLTAEYASTDKEPLAGQLIDVGNDAPMTAQKKQEMIWSSLDQPFRQLSAITGPTTPGLPIAVPLFESQHRWLWLRLTIVTPPGTVPPTLKELRVLYPDLSLTQYLPAVFRGVEHDRGGLLRHLVGVLESTTQRIDERIRSIGSTIDPDTAPDDWLDYLGRWLDLPWDDALPASAKRCLLKHAGELLEMRGTRKGLQQLLHCLVGSGGVVSIADLTVDHTPTRLGGRGCVGGALPVLLAGVSPRVAILGGKAILGRAQLTCRPTDCDPLQHITPAVCISLATNRPTFSTVQPILTSILAQYIPTGVKPIIKWRVRSDLLSATPDVDDEVLDANGPGALGDDSVVGRTVLGGRSAGRITETGMDLGFRLN